jgi:hypothetical protein
MMLAVQAHIIDQITAWISVSLPNLDRVGVDDPNALALPAIPWMRLRAENLQGLPVHWGSAGHDFI